MEEALRRIEENKKLFQSGNFKKSIYLGLDNCALETLPNELFELTWLKGLYLYENRLTEIPLAIKQLTELQILDVQNNFLTDIPFHLLELVNIEEIGFLKNPYRNPSSLVNSITDKFQYLELAEEIELLKILKKSYHSVSPTDYKFVTLKVPKELQSPLLQYLSFFQDYIEATKKRAIVFEVKRERTGLTLITNGNSDVDLPLLGRYFQEYVSLTKQSMDSWVLNFEKEVSSRDADLLRLKLQSVINNLESLLEIARFENEELKIKLADKNEQILFLQELSTSLSRSIEQVTGKSIHFEHFDAQQLLLDLTDKLIRMAERKHTKKLEDLHNDELTDYLRDKNYYTTDQTRTGKSQINAGEADILIRKRNGTPISIIEAFRLSSCGKKNTIVSTHIDKLLNDYDTIGHETNFIIIYSEAANFSKLWSNYQKYMAILNDKPDFRKNFPILTFKEPSLIRKSALRIGLAEHARQGKVIQVYHILVDMYLD